MIKIAICDDKKEQIKIIKEAVCSYEERTHGNFSVECFDNSFEFAGKIEGGASYDVLLLDICMPGLLGTEVAKTVRQRKDKTEIVFLTTSDEFAVDAFALKAAHYLLKPFTQSAFDEAMDRALASSAENEENVITIKIKNGVREVPVSDVLYCESYNHLQTVYLKNERIETRESITEFFTRLKEISNLFISPCKGYFVNLSKIQTLQKNEMILTNGDSIPVSTRLYSIIKDAYFNYRFGGEK